MQTVKNSNQKPYVTLTEQVSLILRSEQSITRDKLTDSMRTPRSCPSTPNCTPVESPVVSRRQSVSEDSYFCNIL